MIGIFSDDVPRELKPVHEPVTIRSAVFLGIIILVVFFGPVECRGRFHPGSHVKAFLFQGFDQVFRDGLLIGIQVKNFRTVIIADVRPLPVELGRIMDVEEIFCQAFIIGF